MDGENNGNPYVQMDDLGGFTPYIWRATHIKQPTHCSPLDLHQYGSQPLDGRLDTLKASHRHPEPIRRSPVEGDTVEVVRNPKQPVEVG